MSMMKEHIENLTEAMSKKYEMDYGLVMDIFAYFGFHKPSTEKTLEMMQLRKENLTKTILSNEKFDKAYDVSFTNIYDFNKRSAK